MKEKNRNLIVMLFLFAIFMLYVYTTGEKVKKSKYCDANYIIREVEDYSDEEQAKKYMEEIERLEEIQEELKSRRTCLLYNICED